MKREIVSLRRAENGDFTMDVDFKDRFVAACREFGIGDLTIGHRPVWGNNELQKRDWEAIYHAYLGFQHQVKLIVSAARARA